MLNFIKACKEFEVEMMMVGGGAVNFHGYQRHSADIDFWINPTKENFTRLIEALNKIGIEIKDLPIEVLSGEQNISIKVSPVTDIELITRFNSNKTFKEASKLMVTKSVNDVEFKVISLGDLINSKVKLGRYKDLLDIYELKRIHNFE